MMLELVHDPTATGVTRVLGKAAELRIGNYMRKTVHYLFP